MSDGMKTVATKQSVTKFIEAIDDPQRRRDCREVMKIMRRVTGRKPVMWGDSIVGFDRYKYERSNGKEFEMLRTGFSPRKTALTLYIMPGYSDHSALLKKLGPHKKGKSCLYLKRLADVDLDVLEALIKAGYEDMNKLYPPS
jgi:hypothetical protein